jgi:hypothetical protein
MVVVQGLVGLVVLGLLLWGLVKLVAKLWP